MLKTVRGNLLESDVEALVNTVNTVGVMGKGIALQFKRSFPENFVAYERACKAGKLQPGRVFTFAIDCLNNPRYIINFPTKRHWKGRSRIEDIRSGLTRARRGNPATPNSLYCPSSPWLWQRRTRLGSGSTPDSGSLRSTTWSRSVSFRANRSADCIEHDKSNGASRNDSRACRSTRPHPSLSSHLLLLSLIAIEVQKLAYFMQLAGQRINLKFKALHYGPYADNLRHVLVRMEGHFIEGYGDGNNKPTVPIKLLPEALDESEAILEQHQDAKARLSESVG